VLRDAADSGVKSFAGIKNCRLGTTAITCTDAQSAHATIAMHTTSTCAPWRSAGAYWKHESEQSAPSHALR
jgi:hypothetical protein